MREQGKRRWQPAETRNHQVRGKVHHPHRETHKAQRERDSESPSRSLLLWEGFYLHSQAWTGRVKYFSGAK